jgi:hypothetical protein
MQRALVATLAVAVALALALPMSGSTRDRIPERISVTGAPSTFAANAPFRVEHGWSSCIGEADDLLASGRLAFELDVDDVPVRASFTDVSRLTREQTGYPCDVINRSTVFNFPTGLPAGTHTLTGHWLGPCKPLIGDDQYDALCKSPAEVVQASFNPWSRLVTFS